MVQLKLQQILNDEISLQTLKELAESNKYKKNEKVQERYQEALKNQQGCQKLIESVESNYMSEQDLDVLLNFAAEIQDQKVSFPELDQLLLTKQLPKQLQQIAGACGVKQAKSKEYDELIKLVIAKIQDQKFKKTKALQKILNEQKPQLMDLNFVQIYNLENQQMDSEESDKKIADSQETVVEEQEIQEQQELQGVSSQETVQETSKQQQQGKKQKGNKRSKKQQQQQQQEDELKNEIQEEVQEQQIQEEDSLQQQQQQKQQEENGVQEQEELPLPSPSQQEVMEIEKTQPEENQNQNQKIEQEEEEQQVVQYELPEDINQEAFIDVKKFEAFNLLLDEKLGMKKLAKKKKNFFQQQKQICTLSLELAAYLSGKNGKITIEKLEFLQKQIDEIQLNQGWAQCLAIKDLIDEYTNINEKLEKLYEISMTDYQPDQDFALQRIINENPRSDVLEIETQLEMLNQDFQKFDMTVDQQEKLNKIKKDVESAHLTKLCIHQFFKEVNFSTMQGDDWKIIENKICDLIKQILGNAFQIKEENQKFLYKSWLFSCICFAKNLKQGDISQWRQLEECINEESDSRYTSMIKENIQFYEKLENFVQNLQQENAETTYEQVFEMIYEIEQHKILCQEQKQFLENIVVQIQQNKKLYAEKKRERMTVIEWRQLCEQICEQKLIKFEEQGEVQEIIEKIENWDGQLVQLKKEKGKSKKLVAALQEYMAENFKHPEFEKLVKKHKISENAVTLLERELKYQNLSYQELKEKRENLRTEFADLESEKIEQLEKQIEENMKFAIFKSEVPVMTLQEAKQLYSELSLKISKQEGQEEIETENENENQQQQQIIKILKKLEGPIKAAEFLIKEKEGILGENLKENYIQKMVFAQVNIKFLNLEEDLKEAEKRKQERMAKEIEKKSEERKKKIAENQVYDPCENISTKRVSDQILKYRTQFTTKLSKYIEDNQNWKMNTVQSVQVANKIAHKLFNYYQNSDKIQPIGERILFTFKSLQKHTRKSQGLFADNFPLVQILSLQEKLEKHSKQQKRSGSQQKGVEKQEELQQQRKKLKIEQNKENLREEGELVEEGEIFTQKKSFKLEEEVEEPLYDLLVSQNQGNYYEQQKQQKNGKKSAKLSLKKGRNFPKLKDMNASFNSDQQQKQQFDIQQDQSISLEESSLDLLQQQQQDVFTANQRTMRIFQGALDNDENQFQQISLFSRNNYSTLSSFPAKGSEGQLSIKESVKFSKFREYLDLILSESQNNRIKTCMGWVESEFYNFNEGLKKWGFKLRNNDRVAIVQWASECKMYIFNTQQMTPRWKQKFQFDTNEEYYCYNSCNLAWICVYKKYKAIPTAQLVPQVITDEQKTYQSQFALPQKQQQNQQENMMIQNSMDNSFESVNDNYNTYFNRQHQKFSMKKSVGKQSSFKANNFNNNRNNFHNKKMGSQSTGKFSMAKFNKFNNHNNQNNNYNNLNNNKFNKFSTKKYSVKKSVQKQQQNQMNLVNQIDENNNFNGNQNYLINKYGAQNNNNINQNQYQQQYPKNQHYNNKFQNRQRSYSVKKVNNYQNQQKQQYQQQQQQFQQPQDISNILNNINRTLGMLTTNKERFMEPQQKQFSQQQQFQQNNQNQLQQTLKQQQMEIQNLKNSLKQLQNNQSNNYQQNQQFQQMDSDFDTYSQQQDFNQNFYNQNILSQNNQQQQQQQQQQYPQQKYTTEKAFVRQEVKPQRISLLNQNMFNQQQQNNNMRQALGDVTNKPISEFLSSNTNAFNKENDVPVYLQQKSLESSFNNGKKSAFNYSTNNVVKSYQHVNQDSRFMVQ